MCLRRGSRFHKKKKRLSFVCIFPEWRTWLRLKSQQKGVILRLNDICIILLQKTRDRKRLDQENGEKVNNTDEDDHESRPQTFRAL